MVKTRFWGARTVNYRRVKPLDFAGSRGRRGPPKPAPDGNSGRRPGNRSPVPLWRGRKRGFWCSSATGSGKLLSSPVGAALPGSRGRALAFVGAALASGASGQRARLRRRGRSAARWRVGVCHPTGAGRRVCPTRRTAHCGRFWRGGRTVGAGSRLRVGGRRAGTAGREHRTRPPRHRRRRCRVAASQTPGACPRVGRIATSHHGPRRPAGADSGGHGRTVGGSRGGRSRAAPARGVGRVGRRGRRHPAPPPPDRGPPPARCRSSIGVRWCPPVSTSSAEPCAGPHRQFTAAGFRRTVPAETPARRVAHPTGY